MNAMFDIGFGEMILLAAIALIAIGPKQLPEVARALGKLLGEVKKTVGEVTSTVANAREETDRAIRKVTSDLTDITSDINDNVAQTINSIHQQPDARPQKMAPTPEEKSHAPEQMASAQQAQAPIAEPNPIVVLGDHPGDPPWVVNPDLPRPDEKPAVVVNAPDEIKKPSGEST